MKKDQINNRLSVMVFSELKIKGVFEITLKTNKDERGFFMRTYDADLFKKNGIHRKWVQESHSYSRKKYTVRGFHFQYPPFVETKLIRVVEGKILFTILDLRPKSKTFGEWIQVVVSARKNNMLYIPQGCAPCMCTLANNCHLLYKMDNPFTPENYDNILWNDPDLKIPWPIKTPNEISEKDMTAQTFRQFVKKGKKLLT